MASTSSDRSEATSIGVAVGIIAPIAVSGLLVLVRDELANANIALILTLVVVGAASVGGRAAGAAAAVSTVLSFDFFFTKPYLSLSISSADDVETTLILLVIGLAVGQLASRLHRAGRQVDSRRTELAGLERLADLVARGAEPADVISAAREELMALLTLEQCRFEARPFNGHGELAILERGGRIDQSRHRVGAASGFQLPETGVELPVVARGQQVARFVLTGTEGYGVTLEERIVAVAVADQVGASLALHPTALL